MRTPHVILLIALCLPLQAGERPELERAVEMFRSNDPGVRAQGTKLADTELRRLLAPLLKAMDDSDPEVRRRAREAILGLVPHHGREEPQLDANQLRWQLVQRQLGGRGGVVIMPPVQPPDQRALELLRRAKLLEKKTEQVRGQAALGKFGVTGAFRSVGQLSGFGIQSVRKDSAAERAGLAAGDLVLSVNRVAFNSYDAFLKALDPRRAWSGARLTFLRGTRINEILLK